MIYTRETIIQILELLQNPTLQQIKSNYLRLVKKWHPDINKAPEAVEKMKQINRAYAIATGKEQPRQQPTPPPQPQQYVVRFSYGYGGVSSGSSSCWSGSY